MKTSVIILTYNNLKLNKKCLASVLKCTKESFEIIVVDNNSQDGTPKYLETIDDSHVKVFLNKENVGFSRGNNQAAKLATGDVLVFLNNDTEVKEGWSEPLLEALGKDNVGVAGPKLLYQNGKIQHAGIVISGDLIPRHIYRLFKSDFKAANKHREYQAVTGACLAIKTEVFKKVGGFNEEYVNGLEDVDLCFKVKKEGLSIRYCPRSEVTHYESVSKDRFSHYFRNKELYFRNWPNIKPDEDDFYREDGFGPFFIFRQHINNRYVTGNYIEKIKIVLKKIIGK